MVEAFMKGKCYLYVKLLQRGNEKSTKNIRPHLHHECVNFSDRSASPNQK